MHLVQQGNGSEQQGIICECRKELRRQYDIKSTIHWWRESVIFKDSIYITKTGCLLL
jgi:hypothetical protein